MERPPRRASLLVALFVAISWGACTFAAAGILAVLLDRNPVETPVPPYAGLVGLALAGIAVWLGVGLTARARRPWVGTVATTAAVYLVIVAAALVGSFRLFAEQAASPFVLVATVLAGLAVVATWFALDRARRRPPPNAGLSPPAERS